MTPERDILTIDEALERVLGTIGAIAVERVALADCAGRILAENVCCTSDVPAADNSAMDGFGVRGADLAPGCRLRLAGDSLAGRPFDREIEAGACSRVMTGGLIPRGVDTVVPVELTAGFEPDAEGRITFRETVPVGANIRRRGGVCRAGTVVLQRGTRIRPGGVGVLAAQGCGEVPVGRRPRVAVLPTGDEVVTIDQNPLPGQVRNSNAWALAAQVRAAGGEAHVLDILRDREGETHGRLREALEHHDLVCTIGGVSMGTRDLVRGAFAALGGTTLVESIKVKPGKPTLFGSIDRDRAEACLLGLPGNPASAFTIFALLGAPWIAAFQGAAPAVRRRGRYRGEPLRKNWRAQAMPGRLDLDHGAAAIEAMRQHTSADLFCLALADVLFITAPEQSPHDGDTVEWIDLD